MTVTLRVLRFRRPSNILSRSILFNGAIIGERRLNLARAYSSTSGNDGSCGNDGEFYDIVIAGGGVVGTTCSVALGSSPVLANKRILLLEASKSMSGMEPNAGSKYSNRVYAISPGSKAILDRLGIWEHVWRSQDVLSLQVWDALSDASISFCNPGLHDPVAHIVESPVLSYAVGEVIKKVSNVSTEFGCQLQSCTFPSAANPNDRARVILSSGKTIETDLLIGADGYNSKVRKTMGSPNLSINYNRMAVVGTLQLIEETENNVAWQRFLPTGGPIALLPLSRSQSSLVWSTTPENAKRLLALSESEFVDEVNSALWKEYPQSFLVQKSNELISNIRGNRSRILPPSLSGVVENSRAVFPLGLGHSAYYAYHRGVLIGDAAHRVHPLGGQGLNLGIGDVASLQSVLESAVSIGESIGQLSRLKEYETDRQRHNVAVQSGLDLLHRLYSLEFPPAIAARSIGLSLVNSAEPLKKIIMAQAAA